MPARPHDVVWLVVFALLAGGGRGAPAMRPGVGRRLTLAELRALALQVGFPDPALAAAIAMAESGGDPFARNLTAREQSYGLWQVNVLAHPEYHPLELGDPLTNAQAAYAISQRGTNWTPWSAYTHGTYRQYMGASA